MGDVIEFKRKQLSYEEGPSAFWQKPDAENYAERMLRIKESLNKINKLMMELKSSPRYPTEGEEKV